MIMFCDIDAFFAQAEVLKDEKLRGKPVVVGGDGDTKGVVASCSYEARRFGVYSGMPLYLAKGLCKSCIFLLGDFRWYSELSLRFQDTLLEFSPDVYIASIDEAYLKTDGLNRLFGDPLEFGKKVKQRVKEETGLSITIGIGITKMIAKMAASKGKPDGLVYIPKERTMDFLKDFPIAELKGFGSENVTKLKNMGINYVGEILKFDKSILTSILNKNGINVIENLINDDFKLENKRRSIGRETTLYKYTADIDYLTPILYYLIERTLKELRKEGLLTGRIVVKVRYSDFKTVTKGANITPTDISQDIFPVAKELLKSMVKSFVRLIGIRFEELTNTRPIFTDHKKEMVEEAKNNIRKKFGFNSIHPLIILNMKKIYEEDNGIFKLHTPSCSH